MNLLYERTICLEVKNLVYEFRASFEDDGEGVRVFALEEVFRERYRSVGFDRDGRLMAPERVRLDRVLFQAGQEITDWLSEEQLTKAEDIRREVLEAVA